MRRESAEVIALMDSHDKAIRPPEFSDDALALAFIACHGEDLRFVAPWSKWLRWNGQRWTEDRTVAVFDLIRTVCRAAADRASSESLSRQLASAKTIAAVEKLARCDPAIAVVPEALDADSYLLNTPGGTVELRTGALRSHRRADLLTQVTSVSPQTGSTAAWRAFLKDVTCDDSDLEDYLQRLLGYTLTGDVRDHVLAFFYGVGANGKSTLLDLALELLGTYARQVPSETLMETRGDRHPTDIANLMGVRLAISSELEEGQHWAEARIKQLTGDATLTGRFMRQDFFEFKRTHKHVICGNSKPSIRVVDEAMRRRIHLIPFNARFTGARVDRAMPSKLRAEGAAVLDWLIIGCLEWQAGGLAPPSTVTLATDDYLDMQDSLGLWLAERCDGSDPAAQARSSVLYGNYHSWKELRGEKPPSQMRFSGQLEQRFSKGRETSGHVIFHGLSLR